MIIETAKSPGEVMARHKAYTEMYVHADECIYDQHFRRLSDILDQDLSISFRIYYKNGNTDILVIYYY